MLPRLTAEQVLRMLEVLPEQHFTQPPPRFTEASLVKTLEEFGIGRPSTYASIISVIRERGYVRIEERRFFPEDVGEVVTDLLVEFFPDIVDLSFTAKMEDELDEIAEGNLGWVQVLDEFYGPFERLVEKNEEEIQRFEEQLDELCPRCPEEGREPGHLVVKLGRYGKFIGCDKYPECRYIRNLDGTERPEPELLDETVPRVRPPARPQGRPVRALRRMLRLPRVPLHQEGEGRGDGRHVSGVQAGRDRSQGAPGEAAPSTAATDIRTAPSPPAMRRSRTGRARNAAR